MELDNCKAESQRVEKVRHLKDGVHAYWNYAEFCLLPLQELRIEGT